MSAYRWKIEYDCDPEVVEAILLQYGFKLEDAEKCRYEKIINNWKMLRIETNEISQLTVTFSWMSRPTEVFFDYLVQCGILLGQIMTSISTLKDVPYKDLEIPDTKG